MEKTAVAQLTISTPALQQGRDIAVKYTCDDEGINPPLEIGNLPHGTQTLALIMEDPDAPGGTYDHWIEWNIPPAPLIEENSNPGISGTNSAGKTGYHPPCPPHGSHRYYFHVFALDTELQLEPGATRLALQGAMQGHILAKGTLMGKYKRQR